MYPSHFSYPYSTIAYSAELTPKIFYGIPELHHADLLYYVALAMYRTNILYNNDPIAYMANALKRDPNLVSIFAHSPENIDHQGKISQAYSKNLTYEPITGKLVSNNLPYSSLVFPIGSVCRASYEYVYYLETGFEAKDDNILHELLTNKKGWLDLDRLEEGDRANFIDINNKICSNSRIKFDSILLVISKYKRKSTLRKALPKKIRTDLWEIHFPKMRKGICFTCGSEIDIIAFEAGHINSVANGGSDTIDNLLPLCGPCNRSMSSNNMYEWASHYYPNAPLFKLSRIEQKIEEVKSVNMLLWLYTECRNIKAMYPNPIELYISTFFTHGKGTLDTKKFHMKFGYWFDSLLPILEGPDGLKYNFILSKNLIERLPDGLVPNESWKEIKKPLYQYKALEAKLIYNIFDSDEKDTTMWGFINNRLFPFKNQGKCGASSVTKAYNIWNSTGDKLIMYTPSELIIVLNRAKGWNVSYENKAFIGLSK